MKIKLNNQRVILILFFIIILSGALLRFYNLGNKIYTPDELFSIHKSSLSFKEIISNSENDVHPPLYYTMLHFWIELFGNSRFATRSLSAIFGVISIFLMYFLGKILFNQETGIIASLVVAISTFHIIYAQELRMYSLMAMLTLASIYFFIKMMKKYSNKLLILYGISSILLLYSHIYGFFIILVQNLYYIISLKSKKQNNIPLKKWILSQILLLLVFIPWILVLIQQIIGIKHGSFVNINWLPPPQPSDLFNIFFIYVHYNPTTLVLFSLILISTLITWKKFRREVKPQKSDTSLFLFLWLLVPILVPFIISVLVFPIYYFRYTMSASLAFYMLFSIGISQIKNKYVKGSLLLIAVGLLISSIIYTMSVIV